MSSRSGRRAGGDQGRARADRDGTRGASAAPRPVLHAGNRALARLAQVGASLQRKEIAYDPGTQNAEEGKTHYGKQVHFITRHGPDITDDFQKARLEAQVTVFRTKRTEQIDELDAGMSNIDTQIKENDDNIAAARVAVTKIEESIAALQKAKTPSNADATDKKIAKEEKKKAKKQKTITKWEQQKTNRGLGKARYAARKKALEDIEVGSPEMIAEMDRNPKYTDALKASALKAGTPTQIVTRFDEKAQMHVAAAAVLAKNKVGWEGKVGESSASDDERKGKLTDETDVKVKVTTHRLVTGGTVDQSQEEKKIPVSVSFVAEDKSDDITARSTPITMLAETGYAKPPI